jgi:hypothetical protein
MAFAIPNKQPPKRRYPKRASSNKANDKEQPMTDQERLSAVAATALRYHQFLCATTPTPGARPTIADAGGSLNLPRVRDIRRCGCRERDGPCCGF